MNKSIFNTAVAVAAVFCIGCGGNSTGGGGDNTEPVKTHAKPHTVDNSIAKSEVTVPEITTFTDARDGKTYKKVTIATQTWMVENLNIMADSSVCYGNNESNCEQYGRLYTWNAAMRACPAGWRLPTDEEWTTLMDYVGGEYIAGEKLKSTSGWENNGNGTDDFGFSALPGGYGNSNGSFVSVGGFGYWWSATENDVNHAWERSMNYILEDVGRYDGEKMGLFSVRCVLNDGKDRQK